MRMISNNEHSRLLTTMTIIGATACQSGFENFPGYADDFDDWSDFSDVPGYSITKTHVMEPKFFKRTSRKPGKKFLFSLKKRINNVRG